MRKSVLAAALTVIVVASVAAGVFVLHLGGVGAGTSTAGTQPKVSSGSASITLANLSSSYHSVVLVIKNTGTANLVFLAGPSVSPSEGAYCGTWGWNPIPGNTNPIYPGESVKGNCILEGTTYKVGAHVTVSVAAGFSDGSSSLLNASVIVVP